MKVLWYAIVEGIVECGKTLIYSTYDILERSAYSYSLNLAEKNKGSLDMVPPKFGDRNFSTFLAVARNGQPKRFSKYGQYIYQIAGKLQDTNQQSKYNLV